MTLFFRMYKGETVILKNEGISWLRKKSGPMPGNGATGS